MRSEAVDFYEKRLSPRERSEPEAVARVTAEADLLEKLAKFGVTPRLLARGVDERGPWHRVERVRFPTLSARIDAGPCARAWVERAFSTALAALAALHEATDERGPLAIVHGDLSPANIAVDDAGDRAVLLDLDLAVWRDRASPDDGAFRGTVAYVAPEVARGEPPTVRSDLFALAASFLHAWTGARPRHGDAFAAVLLAAAERPLDVPADLPETMRRCLAFAPEDRPACAKQAACRPEAR